MKTRQFVMAFPPIVFGSSVLGPIDRVEVSCFPMRSAFQARRLILAEKDVPSGWYVSVDHFLIHGKDQLFTSVPSQVFSPQAVGNDLMLGVAQIGMVITLKLSIHRSPLKISRWKILKRLLQWWMMRRIPKASVDAAIFGLIAD